MKTNSFAAPTLSADAARFLPIDKMTDDQFAELESLLSDDSAPLPLGPLTNEERAENFAELLEIFGIESSPNGDFFHSHAQSIKFTGDGNCIYNGDALTVRQAIIYFLAAIGRTHLIESVLIDARGFDW